MKQEKQTTRATTNRVLAVLSKYKKYEKRLCEITWDRSSPQLDLRFWDISTEPATPARGMTLSRREARLLVDTIASYLEEGEKPNV